MHRWMVTVFFLLLALQGCFRSKTTPSLSLSESQALQENAASNLNTPVEITNSLGIRLRLIPPGEFTMGSPNSERGRRAVERQHRVRITTPFYMATTEVTQAQWLELMDDNPSFIEGDDHPVETIPWSEAVEFCRRLSEKEGKRYRLPTEAEWEYACRAGTIGPFSVGDTISSDDANFDGRETYGHGKVGVFRDETTTVASFAPNAWGLFDMHGNVWEWCADWYGEYGADGTSDPQGPSAGTTRVVRGGCWVNAPAVCRSANRGDTKPESWNFHFGMRVVRERG